MLYVVDTSALIAAWDQWYSPERFPPFWEYLERMARERELTAPEQVLWDLKSRDTELYRWCSQRRDILFTETRSEIQRIVERLANAHPNLRSRGPGSKNFSDFYVIATACHFGCAVVTQESATGNIRGPRIPDVCKEEGLRVLQIWRVGEEQGWEFGRP